MTIKVILLFLAGLIYGGLIGALGFKFLNTAVMKAQPRNDNEVRILKRRILVRCWLRILLDAIALFVLCKVTPMLIGAALGILIIQKRFIIKSIKS